MAGTRALRTQKATPESRWRGLYLSEILVDNDPKRRGRKGLMSLPPENVSLRDYNSSLRETFSGGKLTFFQYGSINHPTLTHSRSTTSAWPQPPPADPSSTATQSQNRDTHDRKPSWSRQRAPEEYEGIIHPAFISSPLVSALGSWRSWRSHHPAQPATLWAWRSHQLVETSRNSRPAFLCARPAAKE